MQQGPYDPNQPGQQPYQGQQQGPQQWPQQNPPNNYQQPPQQQPQYQQQYQPNQYQQYPPQQYYQPPKKKRNMKLIVAVVAVVAILLIASMAVLFWPDGGDDGSETIGSQGGVLSITSGALDGLRIEVPSGASEDPVKIDVTSEEVDDLPGLPDVGSIASRLITINTDGSDSWNAFKMFDDALTVTLPYNEDLVDDEEAVRFYVYDPARDHFEPTGFISQNYEDNTITFQASTFSQFVAVEIAMSLLEGAGSSLSVDTGFRPATDGWYMENYGSYLSSGGLCLGMVTYAKWYYTHQKAADGTGLYEKYREGDLNQWRDDATAIELATRVQLGVTGIWSAMTEEERANTTTKQTGLSIIHGMLISGEPQLVGLKTRYNNGTWGAGGHAILAYAYDNGRFYMYDPNEPGTEKTSNQQQMPFNYTSGFSRIYESGLNVLHPLQFNVFYHAGAKVFTPLNAYKGLYDSAEDGFEGDSVFPNIELTDVTTEITGETPTDTDADDIRDTTDSYCTITGTIDGGQQAVQKTLVFVGNKKFQATVTDGEFEVQVPLKQGVNDIVVLATDRNTYSNWAGFYRTEIKSTAAMGALTVTMSWGQDVSDVDLHVLEPYGRHIYYGNTGRYDDGPYLDFDNTVGYGPEHYYATDGNVMYDASGYEVSNDIYGTYQIAVHYYADHDDNDEEVQPITWTVTISYLVIYIEATGQEVWEEVTYSGYLGSADSGSASSFGSGGGWSEIMVFDCYEPDPDDYTIPDPEDVTFPD